MTKDLKAKMKETQRKHEEEKQRLQRDLDKERQSMNEQRKKIEKEVSKNNFKGQGIMQRWLSTLVRCRVLEIT